MSAQERTRAEAYGYSRIAFILTLLSVVTVVCAVVWFGSENDPRNSNSFSSDAALIKNFYENIGGFEKLREMAVNDRKLIRIANDFTWLDDNVSFPRPKSEQGISDERWNVYREYFEKLKLKKGIAQYPTEGKIFFIAESKGLVTGGSSKGYAYFDAEPSPIVDSLDDARFLEPPKYRAFKRIKGNWYLYLQSTD